eukprot:97247-Chlamydomonas_euryale.AAC.3
MRPADAAAADGGVAAPLAGHSPGRLSTAAPQAATASAPLPRGGAPREASLGSCDRCERGRKDVQTDRQPEGSWGTSPAVGCTVLTASRKVGLGCDCRQVFSVPPRRTQVPHTWPLGKAVRQFEGLVPARQLGCVPAIWHVHKWDAAYMISVPAAMVWLVWTCRNGVAALVWCRVGT